MRFCGIFWAAQNHKKGDAKGGTNSFFAACLWHLAHLLLLQEVAHLLQQEVPHLAHLLQQEVPHLAHLLQQEVAYLLQQEVAHLAHLLQQEEVPHFLLNAGSPLITQPVSRRRGSVPRLLPPWVCSPSPAAVGLFPVAGPYVGT